MDQMTMVAVVMVAALVLAALVWFVWQRRRSDELREQYGPEYERAVSEIGDKRRAESELVKRQERVEQLDIRPLSSEQRYAYTLQWRAVQARFVDDPRGACTDADRLVEDVMKLRGYPMADFDQRAADLSVHHPRVVENYRAVRDIAMRHRRGAATTEDLRQAMVHYRGLFEDLLENREREEVRDVASARRDERPLELNVSRAVDRDDDRLEIPVKRAGERVSERDIRTDREVRP